MKGLKVKSEWYIVWKYRREQLHLKLFSHCKYNFQLFLSISHIMFKFSFLSTNVVFSNLYICQKQISDFFTFLSNKLALFFIIPHLYLLCLNNFYHFCFYTSLLVIIFRMWWVFFFNEVLFLSVRIESDKRLKYDFVLVQWEWHQCQKCVDLLPLVQHPLPVNLNLWAKSGVWLN